MFQSWQQPTPSSNCKKYSERQKISFLRQPERGERREDTGRFTFLFIVAGGGGGGGGGHSTPD